MVVIDILFEKLPGPGPGPGVVEGEGKEVAGAIGGAWRSGTRETREIDVVGVCEPCDAEGGPLLALRKREGNQSPLSLRVRRPQPRIASAPLLLDRGI